MRTSLLETRPPTERERLKHGAEVVFTRAEGQQEHTIYACRCYESWEQWGAPAYVLGDNVATVEAWRRGRRK